MKCKQQGITHNPGRSKKKKIKKTKKKKKKRRGKEREYLYFIHITFKIHRAKGMMPLGS